MAASDRICETSQYTIIAVATFLHRMSMIRKFTSRNLPVMTAGRVSQAVAAMIGIAGPMVLGYTAGHARLGVVASLGGLALSGKRSAGTFPEQVRDLTYALVAGSAAMFAGSSLSGHGMATAFAIAAVSSVAGLLGSISRPLAQTAPLFMLFTIIAANLDVGETHPLGVMFLFFLGGMWTAGVSLGLRPLLQGLGVAGSPDCPAVVVRPKYPAGLLLGRWMRSLTQLAGWRYTLRIALCLFIGVAFEWIWPHHHGYWVFITIVIVVQRDLEEALKRTFRRAAGTLFGVLLTCPLVFAPASVWITIGIIAAAAARAFLLDGSYVAYTAVQTLLVILLLDFGQAPSWAVIADRLAATLVGCVLALTAGYVGWSRISPQAPISVRAGEAKWPPIM
ncbi:MAG TPA: FUSC family protein [Syntrophales bacterium]|nr:FUSC family protein [Syntrophales bacterium]